MDLQELKDGFNVLEYLDDQGIAYRSSGDNVTQGWVNIDCPFCGEDNRHLGIHHDGGNSFHCWVCDESGDILKLMMELEGIGFKVAEVRLGQYQGVAKVEEKPRERRRFRSILPEGFERIEVGREPSLVRSFFERRQFDLSMCQEYGLSPTPESNYLPHLSHACSAH